MGPARKDQARREQMLRERAQTSPLRSVFPQVGQLRVELAFSDTRAQSPPHHRCIPFIPRHRRSFGSPVRVPTVMETLISQLPSRVCSTGH